MNQKFKQHLFDDIEENPKGDTVKRLIEYFEKGEEIKQILRERGFGCTGMPMDKTVKEMIESHDILEANNS